MPSATLLPVDERFPALRAMTRTLRDEPVETALLAYFDPEWRFLGARHARGGQQTVDLPIRTVVRDALAFDARWLVMAHNHPSGDPRPSAADLSLTRRLASGLDAVGSSLFDHLVLGGGDTVSLRAEGWL